MGVEVAGVAELVGVRADRLDAPVAHVRRRLRTEMPGDDLDRVAAVARGYPDDRLIAVLRRRVGLDEQRDVLRLAPYPAVDLMRVVRRRRSRPGTRAGAQLAVRQG